jgi:hypothetical protein
LLLITLLLRAPRAVPVDQLVGELWDDCPFRIAATQVHGYMLHLRRELGDRDGRVLTTVAGATGSSWSRKALICNVFKPSPMRVSGSATPTGSRDGGVHTLRASSARHEEVLREEW